MPAVTPAEKFAEAKATLHDQLHRRVSEAVVNKLPFVTPRVANEVADAVSIEVEAFYATLFKSEVRK